MTQVRASIGIVFVVAVLVSAGAFILRKATDRQDVQTVSVTVEEGGVATIHTSQNKPVRSDRFSVYLEKATHEKGVRVGFSIKF